MILPLRRTLRWSFLRGSVFLFQNFGGALCGSCWCVGDSCHSGMLAKNLVN